MKLLMIEYKSAQRMLTRVTALRRSKAIINHATRRLDYITRLLTRYNTDVEVL